VLAKDWLLVRGGRAFYDRVQAQTYAAENCHSGKGLHLNLYFKYRIKWILNFSILVLYSFVYEKAINSVLGRFAILDLRYSVY
jgi:hypothetical protein